LQPDFFNIFKSLQNWVETLPEIPIVDLMASAGDSPWKILVATMLSSRTKDAVTAKASARLFEKADTPEKTRFLSEGEIEKLIYPVGFYATKSANLLKLAEIIIEKHQSQVPETIDELCALPGVGIKTASLVLIKAFDKDDICVDTHVHRISNLLGWVSSKNAEETRELLKKLIPLNYWKFINFYLVSLGQTTCRPAKRECDKCPISEFCCVGKKL